MGGFESAVRKQFEGGEAHPQHEFWLNYALATNQRGEQLADKLSHWVPSYEGKRTLDIGSGYGGTCVSLAKRGATAFGIEYDPRLLALSHENAAQHPERSVTFIQADALNWKQLEGLGSFDLVTCDNVIEHVPVPPVAIAHIARLLARDGLGWVTAPNAFSFGQIRSECHYGQFGLSLLDSDDGDRYVGFALGQPQYGVSTSYSLDGYLGYFARYGLAAKLINGSMHHEDALEEVRRARDEFVAHRRRAVGPVELHAKIDRLIDEHLARCAADLAYCEALPEGVARAALCHRLLHEYVHELWYFVVSPTPERLEGPWPRPDQAAAPVPPPPQAGASFSRKASRRLVRMAGAALKRLEARLA